MLPRCLARGVAFALLAVIGTAQRTWIVDQAGGPGVHFTDIPPAIAAASPGDRIEVRGTYTYSLFSLTRGIDIEATQGATVPEVWVENVPAGETAIVTGFRVGAPWNGLGIPILVGSVTIRQCAGYAVLSSLQVASRAWSSTRLSPLGGISVERTTAALIVDCRVTGALDVTVSWLGPNGLAVTDSQVLVQRCSLAGTPGRGARGGPQPAMPGASGVQARNALVAAVDVQAIGGTGGDGGGNGIPPEVGGDAVSGAGSLIFGASTLVRGTGGRSLSGGPNAPDGQAINGQSRATADCSLTGGIAGGGLMIPTLPWLASPGSLTLGAPVTLTCHGAPGALFLLLLDTQFNITPVAGLDTSFFLTPNFFVGDVVPIGATGTTSYVFTLPADPAWRNRLLFFQALALQPSGPPIALTNVGDYRMR